MIRSWSTWVLLVGACTTHAPEDVALDASLDAPSVPDAATDAPRPAEDAGVDTTLPPDPCASCVSSNPCVDAVCVDGACVLEPVPNTSPCGEAGFHCVYGACRERGCGDGYREPGPMPAREACDDGNALSGDACELCETRVVTLASRELGHDAIVGPGAIGVDGQGHGLLAWISESAPGVEGEPELRVLAQRIERGGSPVDAPLLIAGGFPLGAQLHLKVAGLRDGWALGWTQDQEGVVRRVLPNGDLSPLRRVGAEGDVVDLALASFGDRLLAFTATPEGLWEHPFDADFRALRSREIVAGDIHELAAASQHDGYALVWSESDRFEGRWDRGLGVRVVREGTVFATSVVDAPGAEPAIARMHGGYALAWTTPTSDPRGDVWTRALSDEGILSEALRVASRPSYEESVPSVAGLGEGWVVGWHERGLQGGAGLVFVNAESPEGAAIGEALAPPGDHGGLALATGAEGAAWAAWSVGPPQGVPQAIRSSFFTIFAEASR